MDMDSLLICLSFFIYQNNNCVGIIVNYVLIENDQKTWEKKK